MVHPLTYFAFLAELEKLAAPRRVRVSRRQPGGPVGRPRVDAEPEFTLKDTEPGSPTGFAGNIDSFGGATLGSASSGGLAKTASRLAKAYPLFKAPWERQGSEHLLRTLNKSSHSRRRASGIYWLP